MIAADQIGVLALPADPRRLTERFFHHRRGVDEDLQFAFRLTRDHPAGERFQCLLHDVVIIAPLRIDGDARGFGIALQRQRIAVGRVAHAQGDDAPRVGPEALWGGALLPPRFHPFHRAMAILAQPLLQPLSIQRIGGRAREAAGREAERGRFGAQILLKRRGVNQSAVAPVHACRLPAPGWQPKRKLP